MRFCIRCGRELVAEARFCGHCGAAVPPGGASPEVSGATAEAMPAGPVALARLRLVRRHRVLRDRLRAYRVVVDDREVGRVRDSETLDVDLSPGTHVLRVRLDWAGSPGVSLDVRSGDVAAFECGPRGSALRGMWLSLFARDRYLALEPGGPETAAASTEELEPSPEVPRWFRFALVALGVAIVGVFLAVRVHDVDEQNRQRHAQVTARKDYDALAGLAGRRLSLDVKEALSWQRDVNGVFAAVDSDPRVSKAFDALVDRGGPSGGQAVGAGDGFLFVRRVAWAQTDVTDETSELRTEVDRTGSFRSALKLLGRLKDAVLHPSTVIDAGFNAFMRGLGSGIGFSRVLATDPDGCRSGTNAVCSAYQRHDDDAVIRNDPRIFPRHGQCSQRGASEDATGNCRVISPPTTAPPRRVPTPESRPAPSTENPVMPPSTDSSTGPPSVGPGNWEVRFPGGTFSVAVGEDGAFSFDYPVTDYATGCQFSVPVRGHFQGSEVTFDGDGAGCDATTSVKGRGTASPPWPASTDASGGASEADRPANRATQIKSSRWTARRVG